MTQRHLSRRSAVVGAAGVSVLAAAGAGWRVTRPRPPVPLYAEGVVLESAGREVVSVAAGTVPDVVPGTRVLRGEGTAAAAQADWLDAGRRGRSGSRWRDLIDTALLDLHVLTQLNGAVAAAWTDRWRYTWPRDASFVAVAFARSGHGDDARRILAHLQELQPASGVFQARYLLDGSGVPDDRGEQLDGCGWVLWAARELLDSGGDVTSLRPLVRRAAAAIAAAIDPASGLPRPSSDYWEVREDTLTLAVAASAVMGAEAAAELFASWGDDTGAVAAQDLSASLRERVDAAFAQGHPRYPRYLGGDEVDTAMTFLLPPFLREPLLRDVTAGLHDARRRMTRAAGGVAPGEGWRSDGICWTPETAMFALAAAETGDPATAGALLDWLDAHRTDFGALPEKVEIDGSPAAVAPLAWTAAVVVLTADRLDQLA